LGTGHAWLPVYDGSVLGANATIAGPAIIEETTTTLLLLEHQTATTDSYGNYLIEVEA
jgi:N-methylhydantoinase A